MSNPMKIYDNFELKSKNSFGISAKCEQFIELETVEDILESVQKNWFKEPFLILGGGSNILFTQDFFGRVFQPCFYGIREIKSTEKEIFVEIGAAESWDDVVKYCVDNNYGGAENLSGIPGWAGSSAVQNIGAYGVEIKDIIFKVKGFFIENGKPFEFHVNECHYAYRDSIFKHELKNKAMITSVIYKLDKRLRFNVSYHSLVEEFEKNRLEINLKNIRQTILNIRNSKLPNPEETGNAGSFFKNPVIERKQAESLKADYPQLVIYPVSENQVKLAAGQLIDLCGLKGFQIGGAVVHEKQALVLVNMNQATGQDVVQLAQHIQAEVSKKFAVGLESEVIWV